MKNKAYGDMSYKDYINSWMWKDKAELYRKLCRGNNIFEQCERCRRTNQKIKLKFHVHHKTYATIGNEGMDDLALLCSECHKEVHEKKDKKWFDGDDDGI